MRRLVVAAALALTAVSIAAQAPVFRTGVDLVRLDVSVIRNGQTVPGLTPDDFVVLDDNRPQSIASVTIDRSPLSVLLVLDTSNSMEGAKLRLLISAAQGLTASLRPADRVAVVGFSHEISVKLRLTADRARVGEALQSLQANGATALRDAIYAALDLRPADESRPVMLLFTDGNDTASWLTERETLDAVRRAGVTIESIDIRTVRPGAEGRRRLDATDDFLEAVADASGGRRWSGNSAGDLRELFSRALDEMRARYVVSFYPDTRAAGWHAVAVRLTHGQADVHTRPGYFVPPPRPE